MLGKVHEPFHKNFFSCSAIFCAFIYCSWGGLPLVNFISILLRGNINSGGINDPDALMAQITVLFFHVPS